MLNIATKEVIVTRDILWLNQFYGAYHNKIMTDYDTMDEIDDPEVTTPYPQPDNILSEDLEPAFGTESNADDEMELDPEDTVEDNNKNDEEEIDQDKDVAKDEVMMPDHQEAHNDDLPHHQTKCSERVLPSDVKILHSRTWIIPATPIQSKVSSQSGRERKNGALCQSLSNLVID